MKRVACFAVLLSLVLGGVVGSVEAQITFEPAVDYPAATNPAGVALGDFNGDQRHDMAVTADGPDKVIIRINSGGGAFNAPVDILLAGGSGPHSIVAVDTDNDTDLDLVITRKSLNDIQILTNAGGVFSLGVTTDVDGVDPRSIVAGDLDGNGFVDVVTSNRDSNDVSVLLNTNGIFLLAATYPVGANPRGLSLADLDGDQLLDIAVASHDARTVDVLLNLPLSPGVFGTGPSLSVGATLRPEGVAAADFDGNGSNDIATSTAGTNLNFATVFVNQGTGMFAAPVNYPTAGVSPSGIVAADFDVDSRRDLAVSNRDSNDVSILANLGGGTFGPATLFPVGIAPEVLAGHDLSANGIIDLASVNSDANSVSVLLNSSLIFTDGFESGDTSAWSSTQ